MPPNPVADLDMRLTVCMTFLMPLHCWLLQDLLVNAPPHKLLCHPLSACVSHLPHCLHGAIGATALMAGAGPAGGDTCPPGPEAGAGGQLPRG